MEKGTQNAVDETLVARGSKYGEFHVASRISQNIKLAYRSGGNWDRLTTSQQEALDSIATKIGRILSGNPDHIDSWHDIGGYSRLVEAQLLGEPGKVLA